MDIVCGTAAGTEASEPVDAPARNLYDVSACGLFATPAKTPRDRAESLRDAGLAGVDGEMNALLHRAMAA